MNGWSIGKKLLFGTGTLVVLLLVSSAMALSSASGIFARLDTTGTVTISNLTAALDINAQLEQAYSHAKSMVLSGMAHNSEKYRRETERSESALVSVHRDIDQVEPLIVTDEGRTALATIKQGAAQWEQLFQAFKKQTDAGQYSEAIGTYNGFSKQRDVARAASEALVEAQRKILRADLAAAGRQYWMLRALMIVLSLVSLGAAGVIGWLVVGINRTLRVTAGDMRDGAQQVAAAATQVSSAAQGLSRGSSDQAASLEETSASMEEMASMTRHNAENTESAARLMTDVREAVTKSNAALVEMVDSMRSIEEASTRVARIIKTIDEIAFQTNILALNAAVEAARAGEAGMGFAVVADEVRNLAQRSAQAARDTAVLIEESVGRSHAGTAKVETVGQAIRSITETVTRVKGLIDEVSVASRQQAQGIDQVTQAISQMEKVTQSTAATAEESAAASEELSAQAETALGLVAELEQMIGGAEVVSRREAPKVRATPAAVVTMTPRSSAPRAPQRPMPVSDAEARIPLESTGTFGSF
jgi:methyl-accepting chemotaxis protein